ncbi:MAG TPA: hypothetical protein PKD85_15985, partial [Saprospiraceae bacterium]|nr:hypothetical protein [Saprospiraceae bacterium]
DGVLIKKSSSEYLKNRELYKTYTFEGNAKTIYKNLNKIYNSGAPSVKFPKDGRVINKYNQFNNNCSTFTCNALKIGGVNIGSITTPIGWTGWEATQRRVQKFYHPFNGPKF